MALLILLPVQWLLAIMFSQARKSVDATKQYSRVEPLLASWSEMILHELKTINVSPLPYLGTSRS